MQHTIFERFFYWPEIKKQCKLAFPVYLAQISGMGMVFVDTAMTGQYSAEDMASVAVAASIWSPTILFGIGCLLSLPPLTAQLVGAKQYEKIPHLFKQGLFLSCFMSAFLMLVLYYISFYLENLGLSSELSIIAGGYLRMVLFSVPPLLLFVNIRSLFEGFARTKPAMVISICGLILNIPLNYVLIYGKFGLPALGAVGCGIATAIVYWFMFIFIVLYLKRDSLLCKKIGLVFMWPRQIKNALDWKYIKRILAIGFPNAIALLSEMSLFAVTALLLAPLGTIILAGHQVAMNISGLLFMTYIALTITVTIRIGTCLGAGKINAAHTAAWTAMGFAFICSIFNALLLIAFNSYIPLIYTNNAEVIALSTNLLFFAATFQIVDAIQIIGIGILRGYNDTKSILIVSLICYWGIGLPLGYTLTYSDLLTQEPMGPQGFWTSYIVTLAVASVFYIYRIISLHRLKIGNIRERIAL